jgi:predicted O-methyltransferase YrrM
MPRLPFRNSLDYLRGATYFEALGHESRDALFEIILDEEFLGATDPQALGFIYSLVANNNYASVLQLGTWMGFSTIVIADAMKRSGLSHNKSLILDTVENDPAVHQKAKASIARAGFQQFVRCIDGSSLDENVQKLLREEYEFIYVDSSHSYDETKREIELYYRRLAEGGFMVFHDTSPDAASWDPTQQGGVRRAIDEWVASPASPREYCFFEKPLWRSSCGMFIAKSGNKA